MKNKGVALNICLLTAMLSACHKNKKNVTQVKDNDMTIEATLLKNDQGDPSTLDYAVRLIPDKKMLAHTDNNIKSSLIYSMDSCFYLINGQKKIYSVIVQPIANGVNGTFEYMLSFNEKDLRTGNWNLFYKDKYLNNKKYMLSLDKE